MTLSHLLANTAAIIASQRHKDGSVTLDPTRAELLVMGLKNSASLAYQLEKLADGADLVAFAKEGELRPSAEILDLSEILGREQVSRQASEAGPDRAKVYNFPAAPRASFDFSQLDGGDAA